MVIIVELFTADFTWRRGGLVDVQERLFTDH
jgi:hypothetical protein